MECDCEASRLSSLEARAHDIWRMPLAIAYWLQMDHGVEGVWDRLRQISTAYQVVQAENDQRDLLSLVVMAAYELASESGKDITVPTRVIAERANQIANMEGGFFDDLASAGDIQRVGKMMKRLGFEKSASHGGSRSWQLSCRKVDQIAKARGIPVSLSGTW